MCPIRLLRTAYPRTHTAGHVPYCLLPTACHLLRTVFQRRPGSGTISGPRAGVEGEAEGAYTFATCCP
jgi:hypothetical protein